MKFYLGMFTAISALGLCPNLAAAQPSSTEEAQAAKLSECAVLKTTGEDRLAIARWMAAAFATAPQLSDLVKVDPADKIKTDQEMARIYTRLIAKDCATESRPLFLAKSKAGFEAVGGKLGEIAITELLTNKQARGALEAYAEFLVEDDFSDVTK